MSLRTAGSILFPAIVALVLGCGEKEKPTETTTETITEKKTALPENALTVADDSKLELEAQQGTSGRHRADSDWVPAEYRSGKGRWKDAAAYVDGVPVGMLWFGELPSTLKPVWVEEIEGLDFRPGDPPPYERVIKVRRYRISEYLEAVGVDLKTIDEIHVYGPNNQVLALKGDEFLKVKDYFYFRFGFGTHGKAMVAIPKDLGSNFDRLMAVAVYIKKKPPTVSLDEDDNQILLLDGKPVDGIPYFGEPMRGGIRVYKDDRLANIIKRKDLDPEAGEKGADGETRWKLFDTLKSLGVATDDIVQLEVIYDERRTVRFDRSELESMTFRSTAQGQGQLELDDKTPVHALTFYSKPLPKKVASSKPKNQTADTE